MCFLRYLQEMDEHPDTYFRYSLYGYLDTAVKKVCEFLGTSPDDTFLIQNATKGIWFFFFPIKYQECSLGFDITV